MSEISTEKPHLSIVVAVRNDNYGGDFNARMQNFITWNTKLLEKYQIKTEIVLVNWNPIIENADLASCLQWPSSRSFVHYRIIDVDHRIHLQFSDPDVRKLVPLYEFVAKNVGVRRAKGQYVLCTNADILFAEETIKQLSETKLESDTLYRATRIDFIANEGLPFSENDAESNATNIFLRTGSLELIKIGPIKWSIFLSEIYDRARWAALGIWMFTTTFRKERMFIFKYPFNACGDFALMDKESWMNGCEYREDTRISTHTDSIQLLTCLSQGFKVISLKRAYVYHQEHGRRFDFGVPDKDMDYMFIQLLDQIRLYLNGNKIEMGNTHWGLDGVDLKENNF